MNRIEYIFSRIGTGWGISCYSYDAADRLEYVFCGQDMNGNVYKVPDEIRESIRNQYRIIYAPVVYQEERNFYYWGFEGEGERLYIFGAVTTGRLDEMQKKQFCYQHKIADFNIEFPVVTMQELMNVVCITYFMLTGEQLDEEKLMEKNNWQGEPDERDDIAYALSREEEERIHATYEAEQQWLDNIRNGILKTDRAVTRSEMIGLDQVGIMAENNSLKQIEYTAVTAITLMTRAAIEGGASPEKMYRLSDLYLQKIAKSQNSFEILDVQKRATIDFTKAVKEQKKLNSQDKYVEQCKDYVAKNLYREIKIENLTEEIGLSRCYLSNKFSKATGMSISQYILKEKLNAAANLLKYSDAEIGTIATYLHFSSPSRFSQYFKKQYGETPMEFRKKNQRTEYVKVKI